MATKYLLSLSENQAALLLKSLEFFIDMRTGRWSSLIDLCSTAINDNFDLVDGLVNYLDQRSGAQKILLKARRILFPESDEDSLNVSICNASAFPDSEIAQNLAQTLRGIRTVKSYELNLTEEEATVVLQAMEFFVRIRIGQWRELIELCLPMTNINDDRSVEEYLEKQESIEIFLMAARKIVMPELPKDLHGSYGVYNHKDTTILWEIYQTLRRTRAFHRNPSGGHTVDFDPPLGISGEALPSCTVIDN